MLDYREILKLNHNGFSVREIERCLACSHHSINAVLEKATELSIAWPLDDSISNEQLKELLFPEKGKRSFDYAEPNYTEIHKELAKNGVTMTLLWSEYYDKCIHEGTRPYMSTQFSDKYRKWARISKATMRIQHKPGDEMEVDWAGDTIPIYDSNTGCSVPGYLFVAVLPCSCYVYAELCENTKTECWLMSHAHAFEYFGGVTRLLIPDNCKTGVISNTKYDTILNKSYQELSNFFDTAIVPTRVRRPQDKGHVEGTVKYAETWILAALRNEHFFSFVEAKEAVYKKLNELNEKPFQAHEGCRKTAYLNEEKQFMKPLPKEKYEIATWQKVGAVSHDYLISDGKNKYSVPFDLIGESVDIRLTQNTVEVFFRGSRVASHRRLPNAVREPIINPDHMTPEHKKYLSYNHDDFVAWGESIGPNTTQVVRFFLDNGKEYEQGFKSCASLTKMAERFGKARLEESCSRLLENSVTPSTRLLNTILKTPRNTQVSTENIENSKGITRGKEYYSRRKKQ